MVRKGRALEILVEDLERLLADQSLEIKSPDFIYHEITKKSREVDVSIKGKVGSHQFLIVLECRDRKNPQDVIWIEQLVSKRDSLKANKLVAISTGGFTKPAIELAKAKGIELRTFESFNLNELKNWVLPKVNARYLNFKILSVSIEMVPATNLGELDKNPISSFKYSGKETIQTDQEIFTTPIDNKKWSINSLVNGLNQKENNFLHNHIEPGKAPKKEKIEIHFFKPDQILFVTIENKEWRVARMRIDGLFSLTEYSLEPQLMRYKSEDEDFAQIANFDFALPDKTITFSLRRGANEKDQVKLFFSKK